jgi:hypothetical protein
MIAPVRILETPRQGRIFLSGGRLTKIPYGSNTSLLVHQSALKEGSFAIPIRSSSRNQNSAGQRYCALVGAGPSARMIKGGFVTPLIKP